MATLHHLVAAGQLIKLDALDERQQEFREIFMSPKLRDWMAKVLSELGSSWKIELTPEEQVFALTEIFAAGRPLAFGTQFNPLRPIKNGVWELKTADVRIFGWFHRRDRFVAVVADDATRIKQIGLYAGYVGDAVRFRERLDLDEPKFVPGDDPNDVVSDWTVT